MLQQQKQKAHERMYSLATFKVRALFVNTLFRKGRTNRDLVWKEAPLTVSVA